MFRYCLDHASVAIEWIDRDGKYTYMNEQTCRSLGYTAEELMQLHLWDIDPVYGKDRFLHDLKEPLRIVTGFLGLLKKRYQGKLDESADQYIGFAVEGATRMQRLIEDLLACSRVGRGGATETVQVASAVDTALENLQVSIQESGAVITRDPMPTVHANPLEPKVLVLW